MNQIVCDGWDVTVDCVTCAGSFTYRKTGGGRLRRTCSEECRVVVARATGARYDKKARAEGRHREREMARYAALAIDRVCTICSRSFKARQYRASCCGPACLAINKRTQRERYAEREKAAGRLTTCRSCLTPFHRGGPDQSFCGKACMLKARNRVHGTRRRLHHVEGELVDPFKVFDRDGWRCRECRCRTPRNLRGTLDPRAPQLDHIVSIADGGEHTYRNTQLLCRACNAAKGRASRGQLVLI